MPGFLVPDHYVVVEPTLDDLIIVCIIWGFTLAISIFAATKAFKQSLSQWRRSRRIMPYVVMIWAEWIASLMIGILSWIYLRGYIQARLAISQGASVFQDVG